MMLALLCGAPGLVLLAAGALVCGVSERRSRHPQGLAGVAMCAAGALGVDAAMHGYASNLLAWPLVAAAGLVAWLVFAPHRSPALRRWSVSSRAALDDPAP